jgi:co-chaperonin GroES (HSP10)
MTSLDPEIGFDGVGFHVLGNKIAVKPKKSEATTPGGLHIPDMAKETGTLEGEVVSVGPEVEGLRVGERVVFGSEATNRAVAVKSEVYYIIQPAHIYCILEGSTALVIRGTA